MRIIEVKVPASPYIAREASTSRVRLGVPYTVQDMYSFLFEYFTVVLAPHAIRCRVAQAE
jgi:hypothetical protein